MSDTIGRSLGGSSLLLNTTKDTFDVRVESDVISLLKAIHQGPLNPEVKNKLRDFIFEYRVTQEGLLISNLQEIFTPLGVTIFPQNKPQTTTTEKIAPAKNATFGAVGRPRPSFSPRSVSNDASKSVPYVEPTFVLPTAWPGERRSEDIIVDTTHAPIPEVSTTPEPVVAVEVAKAPEVTNVIPVVDVASRIREIKKLVNEKVGNPVNLIDAHNEIGREYMNSLLDAMKKQNGGQPQEVTEAMQRLERAFVQVQGIESGASVTPVEEKKEPVPVAESVISSEPLPVTKITPVEVAPEVSQPIPEKEVAIKIPVASIEESPVMSSKPVADTRAPVSNFSDEATLPKMSSVMDNVQTTTPQVASGVAHALNSVALEKKQQESLREKRESELQNFKKEEEIKTAAMDPLQTPEVSSGLVQLLSEWSLFKSSGIFGTGPNGKEHPLYQKLAPLMMSAVIAGRYEGSTPQIKQSITDYMNGWRYEEGVVHEHGETFEHYLRRVIKHILEKQARK